MARISYINEQNAPTLAAQIARIRAARRGKLIPVYGLLLHNPLIADAWLGLLDAVRWQTSLAPRLRELAILRVAVLNGADYVLNVHRAHFAQIDGLTAGECSALLESKVAELSFGANDLAVIDYVDAMTLAVRVPDLAFAAVRAFLTEKQILELTVLVGVYNMHTRVIRALEIDSEVEDGASASPSPRE